MLTFSIHKKDDTTLARRGEVKLYHGTVQTPAFMPVGTVGVVKTLLPNEVKELGADIILGNTYHLYLRPGAEEIKNYGGIQKWNHWQGPVLTDSGGFQVFSLGNKALTGTSGLQDAAHKEGFYDTDTMQAGNVRITEEGAEFTSHIDGSKHQFTPENVVDTQVAIGSDIMMVLDECVEYPATLDRAQNSMERTHRWAKRASDHFEQLKAGDSGIGERHNLFGIAQGSTFADLRKESVEYIASLPFDGIAVGGVSVGEGKEHMYQVMDWTGPILPEAKPHYLMGIGEPEDLIRAVGCGYDMFDCVLPTRLGRYGVIWKAERNEVGEYVGFKKWDMRSARFRHDQMVIDERCDCPACAGGYSRGYIAHLLREREVTGIRLTSVHNLRTILRLMEDIRASLDSGTFADQFKPFLTP